MSNSFNLLKVKQANLFAYQLPFKKNMQFKQYSLRYRQGLILQLIDEQGLNRFAEIAPLPGFSQESLVEVTEEIISLLTTHLNRFWLQKSNYPSIQFTLDSLLETATKTRETPLSNIDSPALLQGDTASICLQYQRLKQPNTVKLKVARASVESDIQSFQHLCALNPMLKIRCDANQAWDTQQAQQFFSAIDTSRLEYIEEPTNHHQTNLKLAEKYHFHLGLDETLQQSSFVYQHHQCIKALVIKPSLIGRKDKIDNLVSIAIEKRLQVSISSSFESVVGLERLKQLANDYLSASARLTISLGLDTLKYFDSALLQNMSEIQQDCKQLELLWTSS